jgi:hypothetical protein
VELEDVLGAVYRSEGALDRRFRKADLDRPFRWDTSQVAEHVVGLHGVHPGSEVLVRFRQALHELLQRDVFQPLGDEGLEGDLLGLYITAHRAGEDYRFAGDVQPRKVVPGVGLGVVKGNSLLYGL